MWKFNKQSNCVEEQSTMDAPSFHFSFISFIEEDYVKEYLSDYKKHKDGLRSIPVSGKVTWEDGEDVTGKFTVEEENFEKVVIPNVDFSKVVYLADAYPEKNQPIEYETDRDLEESLFNGVPEDIKNKIISESDWQTTNGHGWVDEAARENIIRSAIFGYLLSQPKEHKSDIPENKLPKDHYFFDGVFLPVKVIPINNTDNCCALCKGVGKTCDEGGAFIYCNILNHYSMQESGLDISGDSRVGCNNFRPKRPLKVDIEQEFKELNIYINDIWDYYVNNNGKDAGHLMIAFMDKWNAFQKRIINQTQSLTVSNGENKLSSGNQHKWQDDWDMEEQGFLNEEVSNGVEAIEKVFYKNFSYEHPKNVADFLNDNPEVKIIQIINIQSGYGLGLFYKSKKEI